ncbi:hypothetical protein [Infirmifilum sp.]|uniref:hypothetical protein n=1 Tax=Infirmifilum sp. TaxID=2856575 RepID=UPI003D0B69F4
MRVKVRPFSLEVEGYEADKEGWIGTLLTLANGRIGVRGDLDFAPSSTAGSYLAGFYEDVPIWRRELVVLPRLNGNYLVGAGSQIQHLVRRLDMREGLLRVEGVLQGGVSYSSESLAHLLYRNLYAQRINVVSGSEMSLVIGVDDPLNPFLGSETYYEHLVRARTDFGRDEVRVSYKLRDGRELWLRIIVKIQEGSEPLPFVTNRSSGFIIKGKEINVTKLALLGAAGESIPDARDWEDLRRSHVEAWRSRWDRIGLEVSGDEYMAGGVTFYAYHLLQLIDDSVEELMISTRGLHGHGYRGHIFWDTDLYLASFLSLLYPEAMRRVLEYRCRTLKQAMEYAARTGFMGARFPWEGVDDGYESTPRLIPTDLTQCKCVEILTGEQEIHVTSDIALALEFYYRVTRDEEFMRKCGLKLLVETARFWASRVTYDETKESYSIRGVIGPDEYHVNVDDSYYTNYTAKLNLELAAHHVERVLGDDRYKELLRDLNVSLDEAENWRRIASRIFLGRRKGKVIEEFSGFFDLSDFPRVNSLVRRLSMEELSQAAKSKVVKQADVVLALVLQNIFGGSNRDMLEANYDYYFRLTTNESSLSLPVYTLAALLLRKPEWEYLFRKSLETDLENLYANSDGGFHVAAAGGIWMVVLHGLLGLRINGDELEQEPLCSDALRVKLRVAWRGKRLEVSNCREK